MSPQDSPDLRFEMQFRQRGWRSVGVDEVGRGCLAGPVVVAAAILPEWLLDDGIPHPNDPELGWWAELRDSKLLTAEQRELFYDKIAKHCQHQIAWCYPDEIDKLDILRATMKAMRSAVSGFSGLAQVVLCDGNQNPFSLSFGAPLRYKHALGFRHIETVVKGDNLCLSIAAASTLAKVYRDRWMEEIDKVFPGYGFAKHKGYSTKEHQAALKELGPCPIHRMSFEPVAQADPSYKEAQSLQSSLPWGDW